MKIKEAREIVGNMVLWEMYRMGVKEEQPPFIDCSLTDMLKANEIVRKANDKKRKNMEQGKTYRRKTQMVCSERLIAALYVAMSHEPSRDAVALCNNKLTAVVRLKFKEETK